MHTTATQAAGDTLAFLDRLWGESQGWRCVASIEADTRCRHFWFEDNASAAAKIAELERRQSDVGAGAVYHACSLFAVPGDLYSGRKADNVRVGRAFFFDYDFKGDRDEETFDVELRAFLKATGLPIPELIRSGGGMHGYWHLGGGLKPERWQPVATKLKALMIAHGFRIDTTVTADMARILRPVGTHNRKHAAEPKVTSRNSKKAVLAGLEFVKKVMALEIPGRPTAEPDLPARPAYMQSVNDDLTGGREAPTPKLSLSIKKCQQMRTAVATHGKESGYDLWLATLGIAKYCNKAEQCALEVSNAHPDFDAAATG